MSISRPSLGAPTPTLFCVARLIPEKGIFDLLGAFALVRSARPRRLRVAGQGPHREVFERRVRLMRFADDVDVLGHVDGDDLERAYRTADVFVLPSYSKGFAISIMKVMGHGLPVVTTPIRWAADHLIADEHAVFAPPGDPERLALAIHRLLDDEALRKRMGRANVAKVREFSPGRVIPHYFRVLAGIADWQ